jgi:hypothetical protein
MNESFCPGCLNENSGHTGPPDRKPRTSVPHPGHAHSANPKSNVDGIADSNGAYKISNSSGDRR